MRRPLAVLATVVLFGPLYGAPVEADGGGACHDVGPLDPGGQASRILPAEPGHEDTYCLFFGPYTIPPGQDLSRIDLELSSGSGFITGGGPSLAYADGSEPDHQVLHIHHAHWWFMDPEAENHGPNIPGMKWVAGAGEEETEGDFSLVADADPDGPRYGIRVRRGERTMLANMIHNKTAASQAVWLRVRIEFVHGTPEELEAATGDEYRDLTPVLFGDTFDVERGSGDGEEYVHPYHADEERDEYLYDASIQPGVGQVWEAPFSGTIVLGAAHLHPGGKRAIVTNWGRQGDACPNDRQDAIPGTTLYELELIDRVKPFSEEFQIEITQPGFRATVREGDRIVLNGVYASADHAWYEAMSHTGFYVDRHEVSDEDACTVESVGTPDGWSPPLLDEVPADPTEGVPNREWTGESDPVCEPGDCHRHTPAPDRGPATETVTIAGFSYVPGNQGMGTAPAVERGTEVRFANADIGAYVRHTVTACEPPCDGPYVANYPLPSGDFGSGYLGWEPSSGGSYVPTWTLDTSDLEPARYTFFCRVHPWMRGSLYVE